MKYSINETKNFKEFYTMNNITSTEALQYLEGEYAELKKQEEAK